METHNFPLRVETFQQHLNEIFEIDLGSENTLRLELVEVIDHGNRTSRGGQIFYAFNLIFLDKEHPRSYLAQGSYVLKHPVLGENEWFLVPLGPEAQGMAYQLLFNTSQ